MCLKYKYTVKDTLINQPKQDKWILPLAIHFFVLCTNEYKFNEMKMVVYASTFFTVICQTELPVSAYKNVIIALENEVSKLYMCHEFITK